MTPGQTVIFAVGLSFLIFVLAGDYGFAKLVAVRSRITNG